MYRPDTSGEVQKIYDEKIRQLTEEERFLRGLSLTHFCREICLWSLREKYPDLSPQELKGKFFERVYGDAFEPEEREKILDYLRSH
jgi:hypothetical protein